MMFGRFTERAQKVLALSQEEATRLGHNNIGTEHILLGLIREGEGIAAKALQSLGLEIEKIQEEVEELIGVGQEPLQTIHYTPRAKKVVELSQDEARKLGHSYVGTEHILLGLIREGEGVAAKALQSLGLEIEKIQEEVEELIGVGQEPLQTIHYTPRAKKVVELSQDEARKLGHSYVGTEHILLGLIREGEG